MRIPYVPNPPPAANEEEAAVIARVQARRHPRPLQPLDLALLHSAPVADGWNAFLGAVRTRTGLGDDVRELANSRVAVVNRAWYEWAHHAPLAAKAGVADEALEAVKLRTGPLGFGGGGTEAKEAKEVREVEAKFDERQWAALVYADEMTRNVEVKDGTFARVKALFTDKEVVELTATVAAYNCVSRFLVALDVGEANGTGPDAGH